MASSQLNPFMDKVSKWLDEGKDLEEAKREAIDFVGGTDIKPKDKVKMLQTIHLVQSLQKLVEYLYNALLKFEGMGVNRR